MITMTDIPTRADLQPRKEGTGLVGWVVGWLVGWLIGLRIEVGNIIA